jgi:hypothetical protein
VQIIRLHASHRWQQESTSFNQDLRNLNIARRIILMITLPSSSKWKPSISSCLAVVLTVCGILGGAQTTSAGSIIEFSLDNGTTFLPANQFSSAGNSVATPGYPVDTTIGNFSVSASLQGNSPGTSAIAKLLTSTLDVTNNTGTTQTIVVAFSQSGFTEPVSASKTILMNSHVGGSVVLGSGSNAMSFQSFVDQGDGLGIAGIPGTFNTNVQNPNITSGSFDSDASKLIGPLSATYSMTQYVTITLGANAEINFSANTTLTTPEPTSMLLLGIGALGMAGYGWRRRRAEAARLKAESTPAV